MCGAFPPRPRRGTSVRLRLLSPVDRPASPASVGSGRRGQQGARRAELAGGAVGRGGRSRPSSVSTGWARSGRPRVPPRGVSVVRAPETQAPLQELEVLAEQAGDVPAPAACGRRGGRGRPGRRTDLGGHRAARPGPCRVTAWRKSVERRRDLPQSGQQQASDRGRQAGSEAPSEPTAALRPTGDGGLPRGRALCGGKGHVRGRPRAPVARSGTEVRGRAGATPECGSSLASGRRSGGKHGNLPDRTEELAWSGTWSWGVAAGQATA